MVCSCAVAVKASARARRAATPDALSPAPWVARGGTSRPARIMIVPCVRPLETAQMFCSATALPLTVAA